MAERGLETESRYAESSGGEWPLCCGLSDTEVRDHHNKCNSVTCAGHIML